MGRLVKKVIHKAPTQIPNLQHSAWERFFSSIITNTYYIRVYEESLNIPSVAANSFLEPTFNVDGITTRDIVFINPPALTSGLALLSFRVDSAGDLALLFFNNTGGAIDEAAKTYKIIAIRN